jgi:pimeloyl-ACP methyl ester carboxylesterase
VTLDRSAGAIDVAYDDVGAGRALLFIHGHPFDRSMWAPQIGYFGAQGFRAVAPDLRGYGSARHASGRTTLHEFAHDLVDLLDRLAIGGAVVIGLSMGGQIAMEFFRLFPSRVTGLVLAATSARAETEAGKKNRNAMADRLLDEGMSPYAHEVLTMMVAPSNIEMQPHVARHVLEMMLAAPPEGAAAALRGRAERRDYLDVLQLVKVPTLIVVGSDDEFTPVADARLLHERVESAELVVIEGAAHMPNLERSEQFNEALARFLTRVT